METVVTDFESLSLLALKSICLETVRFETNFHRVDSLVCPKPKS